ncbi:MAG: ABC transporter permease, partial [Gemmatimonadota bacterium]
MNIGSAEYTIIGVAPRGFAATQLVAPPAIIPITVSAADGFSEMWQRYRTTYNMTWLEMFARRKEGVSFEAMTADLTAAYRRSYENQIALEPRTAPIAVAQPRVALYPVFEERGPSPTADTKVATWLLGVAGVVLLIACANVGNLLLGRALHRRREIGVRIALGVRRGRLASQLLIESLMLATLGAVAGLAVAQWGGSVLRTVLMPQMEWDGTLADGRVLLFAAATALAAGVLAGIAPIVQSGRTDVSATLKAGVREGYGQRSRMRTVLLVMQAALSVVLLVGAGLFVRSLTKVQATDLGYDPSQLIWVEPRLRGTQLDTTARRLLRERLIERARNYPGVEAVSVALTVPFSTTYSDDVFLPGSDSASKLGAFIMQAASPDYFKTLGTRLLHGRAFDAQDRKGAPLVTIVSKAMAEGLWPGQDAIGKCIKTSADTSPCRTVVGVAENVKFGGFAEEWNLFTYLAEAQLGPNAYSYFVRASSDARAASEGLRRALQSEMPGTGYVTARVMSDVVAPAMRSWQLGATMFAVFGGLA